MKTIKNIIVLSLFIFVSSLFGQNYALKAGVGYGFYNMGSLGKLQDDYLNNFQELPIRKVQSFPPYMNYQFQLIKKLSPKINLGIFFEFLSTGGRCAISDYSGKINLDQIVNGYDIGLLFESHLKGLKHLFFTFKASVIYSALTLKETINVFNQTKVQSSDFSSLGIGLEPGFSYEILTAPINLRANISFNANLSKDFQLKGMYDGTLDGTRANWTGLRLGLVVGIPFN